MKVALIHNFFYPESGATELIFNAASELRKRGHVVGVFVLNAPEEVLLNFREAGIPVESKGFDEWRSNTKKMLSLLDPLLLFINKFRVVPFLFFLARRVNREFDVAFTSHYHLTTIIHMFLRTPIVYYCHEPPRQYYENFYSRKSFLRSLSLSWYEAIDKNLDKILARKCDLIACNSDYSKKYINGVYGVSAKRIYPGVDVGVFKNIGLKRSILLSVGRLYLDLKGHRFVIKSLGLVKGVKPPLLVVGDGSGGDKKMLQNLSEKSNVETEIRSGVSKKELVNLYTRSIAAVFGYVREPFGMTAIEAMACETPVVAVAEGGLKESVSSDTGFLVERDEKKFAEAVEKILQNREAADEMGRAGRKRAEENFTWDRFGNELEETLDEVLAHSRR